MDIVDFRCLLLNQNDENSPYVMVYTEDTKAGIRYYRVRVFIPCGGKSEKFRLTPRYIKPGYSILCEDLHEYWGQYTGHSKFRYRYLSTSDKQMADDTFQNAYRQLQLLFGKGPSYDI